MPAGAAGAPRESINALDAASLRSASTRFASIVRASPAALDAARCAWDDSSRWRSRSVVGVGHGTVAPPQPQALKINTLNANLLAAHGRREQRRGQNPSGRTLAGAKRRWERASWDGAR
jgi:hypothetical protein